MADHRPPTCPLLGHTGCTGPYRPALGLYGCAWFRETGHDYRVIPGGIRGVITGSCNRVPHSRGYPWPFEAEGREAARDLDEDGRTWAARAQDWKERCRL